MIRGFSAVRSIKLFFLITLLIITGCAASARISPINNTFLRDVDVSQSDPNLPFMHSWIASGIEARNFDNVFIKPIRLEHLPKDAWISSSSTVITSEQDYRTEAAELAKYFKSHLEEKIKDNPKSILGVTGKSGPRTIVFDIAFTELEFSHPIAQAATFASPVPGTGVALSATSEPHVAFAARITDGATGKLIATIADRKFPPTRLIDFNKFTVTSSAREICELWATNLSDSLARRGLEKVEGSSKFDLKPW